MTKAELVGFAAYKGYWRVMGDGDVSARAWEQLGPLERRAWIGAGQAAADHAPIVRQVLEERRLVDGSP